MATLRYEVTNTSGSTLRLDGSTLTAGASLLITLTPGQLRTASNAAELKICLHEEPNPPAKLKKRGRGPKRSAK